MTERETFYHLAWAHGEVTVRAVGGMIAPVEFDLGGGRRISPLHVAPWKPDGLSPLMAGLRGEWPCLPFGPARVPDNLPPGWRARWRTAGITAIARIIAGNSSPVLTPSCLSPSSYRRMIR